MPGVEGRVALVTGASRGIGRATAELLTSRGARVMCAARSEQALAELGLDYVVADLGTIEGCELAISDTEERLGCKTIRGTRLYAGNVWRPELPYATPVEFIVRSAGRNKRQRF